MAYREVTLEEIKEVLRRWLRGEGFRELARQGLADRKTVRRYVLAGQKCGLHQGDPESALTTDVLVAVTALLEPARPRMRGAGWELCVQHRDFIQGHIENRVRLTKVRKLLRRREVDVPYATLWRFASSELGFGQTSATIPVADCGPGEELQVDTGWMILLKPDLLGRRRRFRAWIFSAVRSRYRFVYPVFSETTQTAIEACEAAWEFFGGVFKVLIPDNTKAIVHKADPLSPKITAAFLEYSQARGFVVDTTRVRHPKDKARVERTVTDVRRDCYEGEELLDLEHARLHARRWCEQEYGMRRQSTTLRLPREHFEAEEKAALLPAPNDAYDVPTWCDPKVHRDQHALVAKSLYSLPTRFKGRTLRARADQTTVRFYDGAAIVKIHPRAAPGQRRTDASDFPPEKAAYALRDIDCLKRRAAEQGEAVGRYAVALLDSPLPWTRMRAVYALLGLAKRYGAARLNDACATALDVDLIDIYRLRRLLERAAAAPEPTPARVLPIARFLRPTQQFALSLPVDQPSETKGNENS
ncbi:MAG: Mu transposase domain-containing protein [Chloroflexota bacterium]